jgi:putative phage-type endonuclease
MPRITHCEQGSAEWFESRCGVITASQFSKVFTGAGKASTQADGLINTLVAEAITGKPTETFKSDAMQRGNDLEPEARDMFELETGLIVEQVGLIKMDDYEIGCSPDGLIVGEDAGVEIKCPNASTMVAYKRAGKLPSTYVQQVQGSMLVTGRSSWWFYAYHPDMQPFILKVERDDKLLAAAKELLIETANKINELTETLK